MSTLFLWAMLPFPVHKNAYGSEEFPSMLDVYLLLKILYPVHMHACDGGVFQGRMCIFLLVRVCRLSKPKLSQCMQLREATKYSQRMYTNQPTHHHRLPFSEVCGLWAEGGHFNCFTVYHLKPHLEICW